MRIFVTNAKIGCIRQNQMNLFLLSFAPSLPRSEKMCGMQHDKMKLLSCAFMPFSS